MIELSIGPYRSGKTGRLLHELVDYKRTHPLDECLILVPSMRYGRMLRRQLDEILQAQSSTGILGVQVATIYQACQQVMKAAAHTARVLPVELCVRAVTDALEDLNARGQLTHLKSIHELPGTANALYRLFEEFERGALAPAEILHGVQSTAAETSRHQELARIYQGYWNRLDALGGLDQKRLALACRELLVKRQVPGLRLRWLLVDGFDRISPLQAEVIDGLSRHAAETRIAFDYVLPEDRAEQNPQDDEYSWKDSSYNELHKRFQVRPVAVGVPGMNARPRQFAFTTLDRFAEMQETARRCKEAILVRAIKPGQILVAARNIDDYACAAKLAFNQAGLPVFIDQATEILSLPWMKVVLQLSKLASDDFPRRAVVDLLRSPYVDTDHFGIKSGDINRVDKKTYDAEIIGGLPEWRRVLHEDETLMAPLAAFFQAVTPPVTATSSEYCRWFENMLETVTVRFSLREPAGNGRRQQEATLVPRHDEMNGLQSLRSALRTLLSEELLFGPQVGAYAHFHAKLHKLLEGANFRPSEPPADHIYICSAEHAPNRRFDEVFVVGVAEGKFPRHTGESGFVSADERARWQMFGITLKNPREEVGYEKALFRSLLERARKSFWASYPQVDLSGDEVIPSFYFADGTIDAGTVERPDFARQAMLQPTAAREAVFGWLWKQPGLNISERLEGQRDIEDYWMHAGPIVYGAYERHHSAVSATYNGDLTALVESGWLKYKLPSNWSASGLNNYGQCPFKFWVTNMLAVEPKQEPDVGLDVQQKGTLYHRVLELYYSRAKASSVFEETIFQESLQSAFSQLEKEPKFHAGPYWSNEKQEIAFRARRFLEFDLQRTAKSGAAPHLFETKFGNLPNAAFGALTFATECGDIAVRGVIDRIDVERSEDGKIKGAVVLDYKTGSAPISIDEARAGANMQIPIYALAVEQVILPGSKVKAGHYLGVNAAKTTGLINFEKDTNADILSVARAKVNEIVKGVASGKFPVEPYASKACKNCDHRSVCRVADLKHFAEGAD